MTADRHRGVTSSRRAGYTLIELLSTTAIMTMIGVVMIQFYLGTSSAVANINAQATLQSQLTFGMRNVLTDLRIASGALQILSGIPGACNDVNNTLQLTVPSLDGLGQPLNGFTDTITYSLDQAQGVLNRTVVLGAGSTRQAGSRVVTRSLLQTCGAAGGTVFAITAPPAVTTNGTAIQDVTVTLNGSRLERGRTYTLALSARARLRN